MNIQITRLAAMSIFGALYLPTAAAQVLSERSEVVADGSERVVREVQTAGRDRKVVKLSIVLTKAGPDRLDYDLKNQEPATAAYHAAQCKLVGAEPTGGQISPAVVVAFPCRSTELPDAAPSPFSKRGAEPEAAASNNMCFITTGVGAGLVAAALVGIEGEVRGYTESANTLNYTLSAGSGCNFFGTEPYPPATAFNARPFFSCMPFNGGWQEIRLEASIGGCSDESSQMFYF